jgi:thiol-disulfide isomerase/thioredoxin
MKKLVSLITKILIMNKTSLIYPIIIFLLIFLLSLNEVSLAQDRPQIPNFRIRNLSGELFDSRKHQGKPLVLSFFFIRCPPCRKEMPALYKFMSQEGLLEELLFVDSFVKALKLKMNQTLNVKLETLLIQLTFLQKEFILTKLEHC